MKESQKKAKAKYKSKVKVFRIECYPTEADIIAKLEEEKQKEGYAAYIKNLIRADMVKKKIIEIEPEYEKLKAIYQSEKTQNK